MMIAMTIAYTKKMKLKISHTLSYRERGLAELLSHQTTWNRVTILVDWPMVTVVMKGLIPLIGKSSGFEGDRIECQYTGAGYKTRQGVVHFNIDDETLAPRAMSDEESEAHIVGVIFDQNFSLNKGLKLFGNKADVAAKKELLQIHAMDTYEPIMNFSLTMEDIRKALASLMFITDKRNRYIKARKVADGSKQQTYDGYDKSDGSSPTVSTDSIFLTGVLDAHEKRKIAILDIANTFLHAEKDEKILMLLRGKLAETMVQVDPIMYRKYVT